jgi:two-component system, OmpR family, phosphate regulon sensor histidine kinase PhoR
MLKNLTPNKVASFTATTVTGVFLLALLLFSFLTKASISAPLIFLHGVIIFFSTFFASRYALEKFIHKKIKLIYRIIHNIKLNRNVTPEAIQMDKDIFNKVYSDMENWAVFNKEQIDTLKNLEQYRKEFLGNVSHELKTPLFNIQGYLLTLLEGGLEDQTINRQYLIRAEKSVERMISIVEDLDVVSKLESGQLELKIIRFDLFELLKEVLDSVEIKAKEHEILLKIKKTENKSLFVKADKERIRQVLTNLIVNSIKYGKKGGITEIRTYDMDENTLIEISDDGYGISSMHLPRLFERFYRVEQSRSRDSGGSGLGLAIVKHIIEAHQQTINVRSTEGIGSTFSFTLLSSK